MSTNLIQAPAIALLESTLKPSVDYERLTRLIAAYGISVLSISLFPDAARLFPGEYRSIND